MAQRLSYERYYWLHHQIRSGRYPNARTLCEEFEISQKQAQREIEFMRERLGAPLHFNTEHRGYEYTASGYELPPVWFNEEELASLCLAARLADAIPDEFLARNERTPVCGVRCGENGAWLKRKEEGAAVSLGSFIAIDEGYVTGIRKRAKSVDRINIKTARFEGILKITDPTRFGSALAAGIGPAKAFGCGLISLART